MKTIHLCVLLMIIIVINSIAYANISGARSVGLAGAYSGIARGVDAPTWNPANLGLRDNKRLSINLINIGIGVHNNSFTQKQYDMYNGNYWDNEQIDKILSSIPDEGIRLSLDGACHIVGFASKNFALSIEALAASRVQIVKDFFDLLLKANSNKVEHIFDNCGGEAWGVLSYNMSGAFAMKLSKYQVISFGATIKYLQGYGYFKIVETNGYRITTSTGEKAEGLMKMKSATLGQGIGLDLGIAANINPKWTISLGLKNIASNIDWNNDAQFKYYSFTMDSVNIFNMVGKDTIITTKESEEKLPSINFSLPITVHLGVACRQKNYIIAFDYVQGFVDRPGSSLNPMIAGGIEFTVIHWLPFRFGLSLGGEELLSTAVGIGLRMGILSIDIGAANRGGFMFTNQKGFNLAVSSGFWF